MDGPDPIGGQQGVLRLETLLGPRLLHPTTRQVGLTADGEVFRERAAALLADLEEAQLELQRGSATPRGTVRVTATEAYGRHVILPLLVEFLDRWPDLSVEADFTDRVVDIVEDGYDRAISFGRSPGYAELISRVVFRSVAQLWASPA